MFAPFQPPCGKSFILCCIQSSGLFAVCSTYGLHEQGHFQGWWRVPGKFQTRVGSRGTAASVWKPVVQSLGQGLVDKSREVLVGAEKEFTDALRGSWPAGLFYFISVASTCKPEGERNKARVEEQNDKVQPLGMGTWIHSRASLGQGLLVICNAVWYLSFRTYGGASYKLF